MLKPFNQPTNISCTSVNKMYDTLQRLTPYFAKENISVDTDTSVICVSQFAVKLRVVVLAFPNNSSFDTGDIKA